MVASGSLPMSSAMMESWICEESCFSLMAACWAPRTPSTVMFWVGTSVAPAELDVPEVCGCWAVATGASPEEPVWTGAPAWANAGAADRVRLRAELAVSQRRRLG